MCGYRMRATFEREEKMNVGGVWSVNLRGRSLFGRTAPPRRKAGTWSEWTATSTTLASGVEMNLSAVWRSYHTCVSRVCESKSMSR